jgi:hypothetical protein
MPTQIGIKIEAEFVPEIRSDKWPNISLVMQIIGEVDYPGRIQEEGRKRQPSPAMAWSEVVAEAGTKTRDDDGKVAWLGLLRRWLGQRHGTMMGRLHSPSFLGSGKCVQTTIAREMTSGTQGPKQVDTLPARNGVSSCVAAGS